MYQSDSFLSDTLAVVAQNWVDEFRSTWGLDASAPPNGVDHQLWEIARILDQIAARIVAASRTLERNHVNLDELLNTLNDNFGLDTEQDVFFVHMLEAHLVGELDDELNRMCLRALDLVRYLVDVRSKRVRAYLARVGACFLRGLEIETVVMGVAVIDTALQDLLDDEEIRASGIRCGKYVSFGNRIEFIGQRGDWSEATVDIAFRLAKERNEAVHTSPELSRDVAEVMEDLVYLLNRMPDDPKIQ